MLQEHKFSEKRTNFEEVNCRNIYTEVNDIELSILVITLDKLNRIKNSRVMHIGNYYSV